MGSYEKYSWGIKRSRGLLETVVVLDSVGEGIQGRGWMSTRRGIGMGSDWGKANVMRGMACIGYGKGGGLDRDGNK